MHFIKTEIEESPDDNNIFHLHAVKSALKCIQTECELRMSHLNLTILFKNAAIDIRYSNNDFKCKFYEINVSKYMVRSMKFYIFFYQIF